MASSFYNTTRVPIDNKTLVSRNFFQTFSGRSKTEFFQNQLSLVIRRQNFHHPSTADSESLRINVRIRHLFGWFESGFCELHGKLNNSDTFEVFVETADRHADSIWSNAKKCQKEKMIMLTSGHVFWSRRSPVCMRDDTFTDGTPDLPLRHHFIPSVAGEESLPGWLGGRLTDWLVGWQAYQGCSVPPATVSKLVTGSNGKPSVRLSR